MKAEEIKWILVEEKLTMPSKVQRMVKRQTTVYKTKHSNTVCSTEGYAAPAPYLAHN